jgi:hypothetical protein
MSGWIRLYRKLREHPFWRQRRRFSRAEAWLDLLMDAHWRDEDVMLGSRLVHVKRGQVLFSARKKAQAWRWSRNTSLDWFRFLEAHQMVSREVSHGPDGGYTLLTILNYDKYQNPADVVEEDELSHGLSHELSHVRATLEPRTEPREEVKKEKKSIADAPTASAGGDGKGPKPGRKPRTTHPDTDKLLTEFGVLYRQKFETDYLASFARDKKLLHEMLTASGVEEVRSRMIAFLTYGTKWTRDTGKYHIPAFRSAWNELGVLKARGDL